MNAPSDVSHRLDLGFGLELRVAFVDLESSVEVALALRGRELARRALGRGRNRADFQGSWDLVRADGAIELDVFTGELVWEGHLSVRLPGGDDWRELLDVDRRVLAALSPAVGSVADSLVAHEPVVDGARFGSSQLCTPVVLRIFVDERERAVADVGEIVKRRVFPDHPPFVFNTVACVGAVADDAPGLYVDPTSIWFNVFLGYYQLDASRAQWERPFGYASASGLGSEVVAEEVLAIGKADWNWFSNWMYGVPEDEIERNGAGDDGAIGVSRHPPARIGATGWHELRFENVRVASAYESDAPGAAKLTSNSLIDHVWRHAFGLPNPHRDWPQSFIATDLRVRLWMSYWEDETSYHTVIFGATSGMDSDQAFLDVQTDALRTTMERHYPAAGFE